MNELQLSKRLMKVAEFVPSGARVADIGSDHAYLPCFLVLSKKIPFSIAGELNEGPFQSAYHQVKNLNLEEQISVRKGSGLEVIGLKEIDVITIAGMGGALIVSILEEGIEKLGGVKQLILQPNMAADKVRLWLLNNGWELIKEAILEEDEKVYEILVAVRGDGLAPYRENKELSILLGPFLMVEKNSAFIKKWTNEVINWKRILTQFEIAKPTSELLQKKKEIEDTIQLVEEVIHDGKSS